MLVLLFFVTHTYYFPCCFLLFFRYFTNPGDWGFKFSPQGGTIANGEFCIFCPRFLRVLGGKCFFSASRRQPFPSRATVAMDKATASAGFRQEESAAFCFQMVD